MPQKSMATPVMLFLILHITSTQQVPPSFRNLIHHLLAYGNPLTCVLGSRTFFAEAFSSAGRAQTAPSGEGTIVPFRILLADDSMTAQNMGKKILTEAGYEVIAVSNGAAAAKKIIDKPDLFILDVFMPGYTGLELCEKIRANLETAKTPVLLTVGKMEPYNPQDGQRVRADGVIIKPFEANDLLATVQKIEKKLIAAALPPPPPLLQKNATGEYERTMIFTPPQIEEFKDDSYHEWKSDAVDETDPTHKVIAVTAPSSIPVPAFEDTIQIPPPSKNAAPAFLMDDTIKIPPPAQAPVAAMPAFEDTIPIPPAGASLLPNIPSMNDTVKIPPAPAPVASMPAFADTSAMAAFDDTVQMLTPVMDTPPPVMPSTPAFEDTVQLNRTPDQLNEFLDTVQMPVPNPEDISPAAMSMDMPAFSAPIPVQSMEMSPAAPAMDFSAPSPLPVSSPPAMEMSTPSMDFAPPTVDVSVSTSSLTEAEDQRLASMLETTTLPAADIAPSVAPDVEFTAAPKAGHVEVHAESALEVEEKQVEDVVLAKDPSLVTDPTEMAAAFVTKFGVEGADADDDFEGKVRIPGITPLEPVTPVESVAADVPAAESHSVSDFDSQLAARMGEFDASAPPRPVTTTIQVPAVPAPLIEEPADADKGLTSDLMAQMHEAVSEMEVATTPHEPEHPPEPVAAPVVESPIFPTAAVPEASITTGGVDHALATELAAALGAEPPAPAITPGVPSGSLLSGVPIEETTISSVVARVLERMRPTIVLEVQKELDSMKK